MIKSLFASGLLDITKSPQTLNEAERIALEYLQIRRRINSARPSIRRNDTMPSLLGDSQPSGDPHSATPTKSQSTHSRLVRNSRLR